MAAAVQELSHKMMNKLKLSKKSNPAEEPDQDELRELRRKFDEAEQGHVFQYYDDLDTAGKASLFDQASNIDPVHVHEIASKVLNPKDSGDQSGSTAQLEPLPDSVSASIIDEGQEEIDAWYASGMQLVSENKVAVVLMAGGQGTRLGSSAPKGCYDIGLPSGKSLFQLQAERILKLQQLAAGEQSQKEVVVPWYIMTSGPTKEPTQKFFEDHKYFGLNATNVIFFEQGVLPCLTNNGKIILEDKDKIAVAPDGNGGLYQAMYLGSVLSDMRKRGIEHIHAYCVDNCLVKVADPAFIGFSSSKSVSIATKVVRKRNAKESVGLILQKNGKPDVVEYSEIDSETAEATDLKNPKLLKFRAANIVNHYYSFAFLDSIPEWSHQLPHHVARKKIPYIDLDSNKPVKPEKPNGIKLEQFVFDCFPILSMDKFACLEVRREDEFSPLKNAKGTGEDDPDTSKQDILSQGRRWLEAVGSTVTSESDETGVEVSPLISYGGEGLEFLKGKSIKAPAVVEKELQ